MEEKKPHEKVLMIATVPSMIGMFNMSNIEILQDMGYEVHVACDFRDTSAWPAEKIKEFKRQMKMSGVRCFQIGFSRSAMRFDKHLNSYRQLRNLLKRDDYKFIHTHTPIASAIARIVAKEAKTPIIYTAHGFHFCKGLPIGYWIKFYPVEWLMSWLTDILVTINQEDYQRARKHFHAKHTRYLHGIGVDVSRFKRPKEYGIERCRLKREEIGIPVDTTLLLSVGEIVDEKNHEVVIRSLKKINSGRIHYAIAGVGGKRADLLHLAEKLGVKNQVHFLGYRNDISEILWLSDLFVFPSVFEGLPVSLMEAMAAELPVVCSSCRGNADLIKDKHYLFEYDSVDACAAAIRDALSHDNTEHIMRNQKRLILFQKENVQREMKKIYKEINGR